MDQNPAFSGSASGTPVHRPGIGRNGEIARVRNAQALCPAKAIELLILYSEIRRMRSSRRSCKRFFSATKTPAHISLPPLPSMEETLSGSVRTEVFSVTEYEMGGVSPPFDFVEFYPSAFSFPASASKSPGLIQFPA